MSLVNIQILTDFMNSLGKEFVKTAWPMLIQSCVLIAVLFALDFLLQKKVRSVFRYCLWMLVLAKLILPATLSSPVSVGRLVFAAAPEVRSAGLPKPVTGKDYATLNSAEQSAEPLSKTSSKKISPQHSRQTSSSAKSRFIGTMQLSWQGWLYILWLMVVGVMFLLLLQLSLIHI